MGLCKCPKKRVTNLFCFVHKVNVCEECMIRQHSRCVVHSYIQWLQDSDYEPICLLCAKSLNEGDVVRLCCHDLFHLPCLDNYVSSSSGMRLASIKCPRCKDEVFPPSNVVSPVADQLRQALKSFWWGRKGLGLEIQDEVTYEEDEILTTTLQATADEREMFASEDQLTSTPMAVVSNEVSHSGHVTLDLYDQPINRNIGMTDMLGVHQTNQLSQEDDKYKPKDPIKTARRWIKNQQHDDYNISFITKRHILVILLIIGTIVTLLILMTRVGRRPSELNTNFDWKFNPHLKTS